MENFTSWGNLRQDQLCLRQDFKVSLDSSSLKPSSVKFLVHFRYDFGLEVHLITDRGLHFLWFSWSKTQRKGMTVLYCTVSVLGRDKGYTVKYNPLPEGVPKGEA